MRTPSAPTLTIAAGLAAMALAFFSNAGAQDQPDPETAPKRLSSAVFAGGCFWCVESDFDKVEGVIDTVSGYTGAVAEAGIAEIEESRILKDPVVTRVVQASTFWPAEDYHQNYYKKNPLKYRYYRTSCGRDKRVQTLWGDAADH